MAAQSEPQKIVEKNDFDNAMNDMNQRFDEQNHQMNQLNQQLNQQNRQNQQLNEHLKEMNQQQNAQYNLFVDILKRLMGSAQGHQ